MELVLTLLLLYGVQCLVRVPWGTTLFVRATPKHRWGVSKGGGWRVAHPWPAGESLFAASLPLIQVGSELFARGGVRWLATGLETTGLRFDAGVSPDIERRGQLIRLNGRPFVRAATPEIASWWTLLLHDLARAETPDEVARVSQRAIEQSLRTKSLESKRSELRDATRALRVLATLYFLALFVGVPTLILWLGEEAGLLGSLPFLALLHLATLVAFFRSQRRIWPERRGELAETLFSCALYPPLLMRSGQDLQARGLGGFHPGAMAVVLMPGPEGLDFLRKELWRSRTASKGQKAPALDALEAHELEELARSRERSSASIDAPPRFQDPLARHYCPGCHTEYREGSAECTDCRIPLCPRVD